MYLNKANGLHEVGLKLYVHNKEGFWLKKLESSHEKQLSLDLSQKDSDNDGCPSRLRKCRSGSFKCGCKASMTVKRDFKSNTWTVIQFNKSHHQASNIT